MMTQPHLDPAPADSAAVCRTCGACCVTSGEVVVDAADLTPRHLTRSVRGRVGFASWEAAEFRRLHRIDGRCVALRGEVGAACRCMTYTRRPAACREFRRGSDACRTARTGAGLPPP